MVIDRDEFEARLQNLFLEHKSQKSLCEKLMCIMSNDYDKIAECRIKWDKAKAKVQEYLDAYDAAKDDAAKAVVVGSVQAEEFSASAKEITTEKTKMKLEIL